MLESALEMRELGLKHFMVTPDQVLKVNVAGHSVCYTLDRERRVAHAISISERNQAAR